jgi:AP-3 complex subunit beta
VSVFFPSVVVNIVSESFEVKVLVYMFLVRTADQKPEEALLSIRRIWRTRTRECGR